MAELRTSPKDAYEPHSGGDRHGYLQSPATGWWRASLADRFGVSRTPIREALQRLETQSLLTAGTGARLIVASPRPFATRRASTWCAAELEGLAAAAGGAARPRPRRCGCCATCSTPDHALVNDPHAMSRANRRFHKQIHLASHNRFLVQQLDLVPPVHGSARPPPPIAADGRSQGHAEGNMR